MCVKLAAVPYIYNVIATALLCTAAAVGRQLRRQMICRGTDPRCYHDWAKQKREGDRVLIYTRTAGPRHPNLGPPLAAGLNPALDRRQCRAELIAHMARRARESKRTGPKTSRA